MTMIVLGLDTTGPHCSACLTRSGDVLAYASERIGRGHAERLAPMVSEIFEAADVAANDVDRIAVCTGPGSFTGLRVALSFAKGFALPRSVPIVGIDALAATYLGSGLHPEPATVWADVKRDQIMFGDYDGPKPVGTDQPIVGSREALSSHVERTQFDLLEGDIVDVRVMAITVGNMSEDKLDQFPAEPLYARAPDAKLPGGVAL